MSGLIKWDGKPITEPGLYDMPELDYHADPVPGGSFSSTMAKQILKSPANLRHYLDSPRVEKKVFDIGHAIHAGVLSVGLELVEIPDELLSGANRSVSSAEAKEWVAGAYLAGQVPLKAHEIAPIQAAVDAVKSHPLAGPIFTNGTPEVSAFAIDPETGMWLRARFDWVNFDHTLTDLKSANDGEPVKFERKGRDLGYHVQEAFYRHVYGLASGVAAKDFQFATVETSAPYLVDVHAPIDWPLMGESARKKATALYKECMESGEWPGRPAEINYTQSPMWALDEEEIEV